MEPVLSIVLRILPTVIIILLGIWMKCIGFLARETAQGLTRLVMNVSLPALIFLAFFEAAIDALTLSLAGVVLAVALLAFGTGFLVQKLLKKPNRFLPALFSSWLTGPIAFPLFATILAWNISTNWPSWTSATASSSSPSLSAISMPPAKGRRRRRDGASASSLKN